MRNYPQRLFTLILLLSLAACSLPGGFKLPASLSEPTSTPVTTPTTLPQSAPTPTLGTAVPPNPTATPVLTLWLPPDFDPAGSTAAGKLLSQRLQEFSRQNNGVRVQVRIKSASGPGGLLESLNAASAAAPLALPSVIALSRADLEVAALKGLIYPLDGMSTAIDQTDWYDYARQLAMVQGSTFALPFAGDALVLVYRPSKVAAPPSDWPAIFHLGQPLGFPAGDGQALFVLAEYQSAGGAVEDAQRRPTLQPEVLSQVLTLLANGEQSGVFPYWLSQYETSGQVWQAYRDGRVNVMVSWVSAFLASLPPDTTALPIPALDATPKGAPKVLATGWGWALADPDPTRRALSAKLVEFLSEGSFLAGWTETAGYLPTRPSALAGWSSQSLKTLLSPVAVSAQARPSVDQLSSLGPVLKEATLKVLKREADPTQAAQAASEKLQVPETR